jgi:hypothetical protein
MAMLLVSASVLLYEIAITRLLSVVLWYHFAFLSISVAMLGLGASGVWLSLRRRADRTLAHCLLAAGAAIPLSVIIIVKARPTIMALGLGQPAWIAAVIAALLAPMSCLGAALCLLLISAEGKSVGRMYAADMWGGTAGAVLVIPAMNWVPTPELLALAGLLPLASFAVLYGVRNVAWISLSITIVATCAWGPTFDVTYTKMYSEEGAAKPLYEVWTSTARVTVLERPIFSARPDVPWGWGYGSSFRPRPSPERWIDQDGSAGTPVEQLEGTPKQLEHLLFDVTSLAYQIATPHSVCILGAGGGRDILTALASGAQEVDAVEMNAAIVRLVEGPLASFAGDVYRLPGVHAVTSEGRTFMTRTKKRYDLVQISLVDSWAATAAGAYSLSENYLYTVESFRHYLQHLAPGGALTVSRWSDAVQPFEGARLLLLAEEALRQEGAEAPRDHLLFLSGGPVGTLVVSKDPLGKATLQRADEVAQRRGFLRLWPEQGEMPSESLIPLVMRDDTLALLTKAGLDLTPPTDDRPFFFQAARFFQLGTDAQQLAKNDPNLRSIATLRLVLGILAPLTLALFFLPFALVDKPLRGPGFWSSSGYFGCIGAGFMLLEIPWMQRSILFLGHPSYAAAVVLGAMLLGAGLGAARSSRVPFASTRRLFLLLPFVAGAASLLLAPLFRTVLAAPLAVKILIAASVFGGVGVFMGMALPLGFTAFGDDRKAWLWAVNGVSGVLASALSVAVAISAGFLVTSLAGVVFYAIAALLVMTRVQTALD